MIVPKYTTTCTSGVVLVLLIVQLTGCLMYGVQADCVYENIKYSEGSSVPTAEPCLRCACARGALLCYLRVCPELPDPPPRGCVILHRHHTCCPELICPDLSLGGNKIEARFEPDPPEIPYNQSTIGNGCVLNGTVYGSGSAMTSSSLCEYCYCISGKQQCVKPTCLLPLEGCTASYAPYSCCPTHYKCAGFKKRIVSTTTTATTPVTTEYTGGGCLVSGKIYAEGGKILGVGHSPCDNCYCMQGAVRCVPLSCAPALLGCTPVVRPGECCAASYNCSGVIEVQPRLNYGHYPVVSKEYAKLRKEVQQKYHYRPTPILPSAPSQDKNTQYIIAKSPHHSTDPKFVQKSSTPYYFTSTPEPTISTILPTVRQFMATTRHLPVKLDIFSPETNKYSKISLTTTKVNSNFDRSSGMRPVFNPSKLMARTPLPVELASENPTIMLSPVYKGADSPRSINNEFIAPLTTTNEGLTYSSSISKRKYENSTPKIFKYSNYVDIDFGDEIFMDGRNNRRIDDQINAESKLEIINETMTDNPTVSETTESVLPTETTILTTTLGDFMSTTDISTTEEGTTTQDTTTQISTTETTLNNSTTNQIIMSSNVTMNGISTGNITNLIQINSTKNLDILIKHNETNLTSNINITGTKIIGNNTECIDGSILMMDDSESIVEHRNDDVELIEETTTNEPTTTLEPDVTSIANPNILDNKEISSKNEDNTLTATLTPFKKIPPEIESILNITKNINKKDEDYEYDYNEPSLPPSLPNLKIIPFEAADAITKEKDSATIPYATAYPPHPQDNLRGTDDPSYGYTLNLFSPPVETEGGFVPRDPPILNTFYENGYHTTGIVDITAGTAVPAITNPPKSDEHNCIVEGREVRHGELTSEVGACSVCLCLFGDIVCQPPKCPAPPVGCRRAQPSSATPICCGHVVCNGDEESPTVVLDRIDVTNNPQENIAAEGIATHDPFRDVIRTEPAPDLQSLIGDIMPYLARHTSTLKPTTSTNPTSPGNEPQYTSQKYQSTADVTMETKQEDDSEFSFDSVFKLLFSDEKQLETIKPNDEMVIKKDVSMTATPTQVTHAHTITQSKYRTTPTPNTNSWYLPSKIQTDLPSRNSIEGPSSVGLLKLAGCNIYGRMYRVGRIISELSGPCLECMCTEVGVQCRPLNC